MAFFGRSLPDVVKEQSRDEQVDVIGFGGQIAERVLFPAAQFEHGFDGDEGVLVDRIAMVEIADDQRFNFAQLRENGFERVRLMHGAQGLRGMGEAQDFAERSPDGLLRADPALEGGHVPLHAFLGIGRERQAVPADEFEQAQQESGVGFEAERRAEKHLPVQHGEIGVGEPGGTVAEIGKQRTAFGFEAVQTAVGEPRDTAHGAIVFPHQGFGRAPSRSRAAISS